jgi:uncharacterized membrane protein (UPF0127 family)
VKNANPVYRLALGVALSAGAVGLTGCGREQPPPAPERQGLSAHFPIRMGGVVVRLQVAALPSELEHGLMGRTDLAPDEGMIFVFDRPQPLAFWMRNTPIALDVGYLNPDGTLAEVYPMYPRDERAVKSRSSQLQYALEMNLGWFSAHHLKVGDQIDVKALEEAIRARGFDPALLGMPRLDSNL